MEYLSSKFWDERKCGGCERLVYGNIRDGWFHSDSTPAGSKCIEVWRKREAINFMKELEAL